MEIAHLGYVTDDLSATVERLSGDWGLTFVPALDADLDVRVGGILATHRVRSVWSLQGPPHVEVIHAVPGSPWRAHPGLDHVGYWVQPEVFQSAVATLPAGRIDAVSNEPAAQIRFVYVSDRALGRIELVDRQREAAIADVLARGRAALGGSMD